MPVFAAGDLFSSKTFVAESYVQQEMTSKIVGEVSELREEYAKHFVCEDGSYVVATYTEPVHYKENGEWKGERITDPKAYLFSLRKNGKIIEKPKKYHIKPEYRDWAFTLYKED